MSDKLGCVFLTAEVRFFIQNFEVIRSLFLCDCLNNTAAKTLEPHLTYRYAKKFEIPYNVNPNVFVPKKLFYHLDQKFLENDNLLLKLLGKIKKIYRNVTLISTESV